jgi:putative endonuclease
MEEVIGSTPIFSTKVCECRPFLFMEYHVYIIYSTKCDKYYVGHTESLLRRLDEHNDGRGGQFSSACVPWELVYSEPFVTRAAAMKREKDIKKKKSRKYIEWLIANKA